MIAMISYWKRVARSDPTNAMANSAAAAPTASVNGSAPQATGSISAAASPKPKQ